MRIYLFPLISLATILISAADVDAMNSSLSTEAEQVFKLLCACPSWEAVNQADLERDKELRAIQKSLEGIRKYQSNAIAEGAQKYMDAALRDHIQINTWDLDLIRLLSRMLFEVPERMTPEEWYGMSNGVWRPFRNDGNSICLLWPWVEDQWGHLELKGCYTPSLYMGPTTDPVYELRTFAAKFKRRPCPRE
jgi:hypothetical protein